MSRSFALADLIALNDEIAAISRAGMPISSGLLGLGADAKSALGKVAHDVGRDIEAGASLDEALSKSGALPPVYRAVVEAGMRAGRLPAALESMADYARGYEGLRHTIGQALVYPLMVLLFGYGLFLAFLTLFVPRVREAFNSLRVPGGWWAQTLEKLGGSAIYWGPILPLLVIGAVGAWAWGGRARGIDSAHGLRWVPWLGTTLADWRASNFAGLLAILSEHGVPFGEALVLAGRSSGDRALGDWANTVAGVAESGTPPYEALSQQGPVPAMLRWLLVLGSRQGTIALLMRHAAELYKRRAMHKAEMLRVTVPTLLMIGIGGLSALLYVLTVFGPWTRLLDAIGRTVT